MNLQATKTPAVTTHNHSYDRHASDFARAASFEKSSIIGPEIQAEVEKVTERIVFRKGRHKIVDIGCGPFLLSAPFVREGFHVDGVDPSQDMLTVAKNTINLFENNIREVRPSLLDGTKGIRLVKTTKELKQNSYKIALLNFVHQCAPDEHSLVKIFEQAAGLLRENSRLIITGAHPDYLHEKHSCCEYDVTDPLTMNNGDAYTGRIFNDMGVPTYELSGDHFWSLDSLQHIASRTGFSVKELREIDDKKTTGRNASKTPAYFLMSLQYPA